MFCKNCGKQIAEGIRFCPECGKETGAPVAQVSGLASAPKWTPPKNVRTKEERYKRHCPRCKSENITMDTVVETRSRGIIKILLYVILILIALCLCVIFPWVGIILLIVILLLAFRKRSRTVTYAVCQNCGKRWKAR